MAASGRLVGIGALVVAGERFEGLRYDIEVSILGATVRLWGNEAAFTRANGGPAVLQLEDGFNVRLETIQSVN